MEGSEVVVFWVCGTLAVIGAIGLIISRKAVHSALWVALTMINLAVLYIANSAPFLGMVQIIVYTGAVMMLFLFVLMVVGVDSSDSLVETLKGQRWAAIILAFGYGILLVSGVANGLVEANSVGLDAATDAEGGNVQGIAHLLFTDYLLAFEATSALLITAALGAMVLAHRERWQRAATQRELSEARTRTGAGVVPLPNPGVYARHTSSSSRWHSNTPVCARAGPWPRRCTSRRPQRSRRSRRSLQWDCCITPHRPLVGR